LLLKVYVARFYFVNVTTDKAKMNVLKKAALAAAVSAVFSTSAFAGTIVQSVAGLNYDHYSWQGWSDDNFGQINLAQGTTSVSSLTGASYTYDQGWGGYAPCCNAVNLDLYSGSTLLWQDHFAGGNRASLGNDPQQSYVISAAQLDNLNNALQGIDWSLDPSVSLQLHGDAWAYPGWELHVRDAGMTVTSNVPEPGTVALLGLGILGMGALRRKGKC
jgi:hypothetical protein